MNENPKDWKTYDEFAYGIDTNRLPASDALAGSSHRIGFDDGRILDLAFGKDEAEWSDGKESATDKAEVIEVAPNTYFIEIVFAGRPREAETLILNVETRRVLSIYSIVRDAKDAAGEPQVAQVFRPGIVEGGAASGPEPAESRDLIGLRAHFTYSPNHVYEHTYLSSQRYAWQCLVGVQRGHGDVDLTTTYRFDENQYVFTFREFKIPVASTFFYNFDDMRSTGKFLGITGDGRIQNSPAGAFIRKASMTYYLPSQEPV
ncbi:MoaF C-terminal domain-containing protein [Rhizobium sp. BT03]|uniref:MoaF C-terminal domain-containing protein n=1 Tax=Rhizobium sp. BT03 TaxID=3045156 RepID=UPI0024B3D724|nr:MoaF C-terminal domain-containing protein [Rhizobium sp. BT03]WHO76710.1 molybdenum cofactor biosynthesis F family protein [Rhizobium sp. BT03]